MQDIMNVHLISTSLLMIYILELSTVPFNTPLHIPKPKLAFFLPFSGPSFECVLHSADMLPLVNWFIIIIENLLVYLFGLFFSFLEVMYTH